MERGRQEDILIYKKRGRDEFSMMIMVNKFLQIPPRSLYTWESHARTYPVADLKSDQSIGWDPPNTYEESVKEKIGKIWD